MFFTVIEPKNSHISNLLISFANAIVVVPCRLYSQADAMSVTWYQIDRKIDQLLGTTLTQKQH